MRKRTPPHGGATRIPPCLRPSSCPHYSGCTVNPNESVKKIPLDVPDVSSITSREDKLRLMLESAKILSMKVDYDKKQEELRDKQYNLNIEREEHTRGDHQYHIHEATVCNLSRRMGKIFKSSEPEEKRVILNFLLQNATATGKTPIYTMKNPFEAILVLAHRPTDLRGLYSVRTSLMTLSDYSRFAVVRSW